MVILGINHFLTFSLALKLFTVSYALQMLEKLVKPHGCYGDGSGFKPQNAVITKCRNLEHRHPALSSAQSTTNVT